MKNAESPSLRQSVSDLALQRTGQSVRAGASSSLSPIDSVFKGLEKRLWGVLLANSPIPPLRSANKARMHEHSAGEITSSSTSKDEKTAGTTSSIFSFDQPSTTKCETQNIYDVYGINHMLLPNVENFSPATNGEDLRQIHGPYDLDISQPFLEDSQESYDRHNSFNWSAESSQDSCGTVFDMGEQHFSSDLVCPDAFQITPLGSEVWRSQQTLVYEGVIYDPLSFQTFDQWLG